jgi:LPS export ABC transporter protein LptC
MRTLLLGLLFLILAVLSAWLAGTDEEVLPVLSFQDDQVLDYYLRDVKTTTLGLDGQPIRTLHAAEIRHFQMSGGTWLRTPVIGLHSESGPPWKIVADTGLLSDLGETLFLQGAVQITRAKSAVSSAVQLDTHDVRVQPQKQYIETAEPVQIVSEAHQLQAVGLRAWLQMPMRLQFLQSVKGVYVPENE